MFPRSVSLDRLRGPDVLLAIEVSDSSLHYDTGRKIGIYAAHGIAEVWVIDAKRLVTRVHRALGVEGYREVFEVAAGEELVCVRRAEIRLTVAQPRQRATPPLLRCWRHGTTRPVAAG